MKKNKIFNKIFVACDSTSISKIKKIIKYTSNTKIKIGYKFGLEFLNSKHGRNFVSKLKKKLYLQILNYMTYQILVYQQLKQLRI